MPIGYRHRLEQDLSRWQEQGLIESDAVAAMLDDVDARSGGPSFSAIAVWLGVVCLCFASMTFVAANWDELSRLSRLLLVVTALWLSYVLVWWFARRRRPALAEGFVLLGCGVFGAAIMLVSQIYQMQGEPRNAVLLWAAGTLLAALTLRTAAALVLASLLLVLWHALVIATPEYTADPYLNAPFVAMLLLVGAAAVWLRSLWSGHVLVLGALLWLGSGAVLLTGRHEDAVFALAAFLLCFLLFALTLESLSWARWPQRFAATLLAYLNLVMGLGIALFVALPEALPLLRKGSDGAAMVATSWPLWLLVAATAVVALQSVLRRASQAYDHCFIVLWMALIVCLLTTTWLAPVPFAAEALALAFAVWSLRMGARHQLPAIVRLGYLFFAAVLLLVYVRAAGSLLGTSGFYFAAGLLLVLGALFLPRLLGARSAARQVEP